MTRAFVTRFAAALAGALGLLAPAAAYAQSTASSYTSATRYDPAGRITGTIAPDPDGSGTLSFAAERSTYDGAGRKIRTETGELAAWQSEAVAPTAWANFTVFKTIDVTYDGDDRKIRESISSGGSTLRITQYSYDAAGRLECTAIRMNPAAFGALPGSACSLGTQGSQGPDRITKNVYDAAGQLVQVRKALGTIYEQAYVTYSYTTNGQQEYVVDANGNRAKLTYDGFDRKIGWYFPSTTRPTAFNPATAATALATAGGFSSSDYESYGLDAEGNRTSLRKRDGRTLGFQYDALNRMTLKQVPDACVAGYACTNVAAAATRDVYYSYDLRGLQTAARFDSAAGSDAVTSGYDGFGRLVSSTTSMGGVSRSLAYQYDANGNRTRVTHPDGTYFTHEYDGLDRLAVIRESGGPVVATVGWGAHGQPTGEVRGAAGTSYGYDGALRIASLAHDLQGTAQDLATTFAYNPASQIATRTRSNPIYAFDAHANVNRAYATNGLNQYLTSGGVSLGYDANGNLTASGTTAYTYDAENRLVVASTGATLAYDPLGRLYETSSSGPAGATRFLYDGDALVAEFGSAGILVRRYVHGAEDDDPLLWYEGATLGDRRSLQADHQGSIVSVANAFGASMRVNSYDEYGIPGAANLQTLQRFQYTGQAWIPELGMYHYKARIYSPTLGRFLQTDPIGYEDQINLYTYVYNDPVVGRDPTGKCGPLVIVCGIAIRCAVSAPCRGAVVAGGRWAAREVVRGVVGPFANEKADDGPFEQDRVGKIQGGVRDVQVADKDLERGEQQLYESIEQRKREQKRFDKGRPDGTKQEKEDYKEWKNHQRKIDEERDKLREISRRIDILEKDD